MDLGKHWLAPLGSLERLLTQQHFAKQPPLQLRLKCTEKEGSIWIQNLGRLGQILCLRTHLESSGLQSAELMDQAHGQNMTLSNTRSRLQPWLGPTMRYICNSYVLNCYFTSCEVCFQISVLIILRKMEDSLEEQENWYGHFSSSPFSLENHSGSHLLNYSYLQILSLWGDLTPLISPNRFSVPCTEVNKHNICI